MKKRILCISATLLALSIIIAVIFGVQLMTVGYNHVWKYSADYQNFANDFNVVKNFVAAEFPNESDIWLSISNNGDGDIKIYDPEAKNYIILPSNVASSLASIYYNAFPDKDSNFDTIRIHGNRISFCISSGEYALVYSPDTKPSWVNSPGENSKVKIKSIQDGWYHVTKN